MTGRFPSYKLEEIELILFFKSCIIQIFGHQVCMNSLFYTIKLVEFIQVVSYKSFNVRPALEMYFVSRQQELFSLFKETKCKYDSLTMKCTKELLNQIQPYFIKSFLRVSSC